MKSNLCRLDFLNLVEIESRIIFRLVKSGVYFT